MPETRDMTEGKPLELIVSFALPLMFGYLFQQLYSVVDSAVVGRLIGVDAFAAVGSAGFLSWMVISIVMGFTQGFGILFAQRFGGKDIAGVRRAVAMSILMSAVIGVVLTVCGILTARPVLQAIGTPTEILDSALTYLYWLLGGTLVMISYNTAASVLRALGNSKTPLYAVILSSIINVVLDFVLVAGFQMGVEGVAIATIISQLCSLLFCIQKLRKVKEMSLGREDYRPDWGIIKELLRLSAPLAFRDAVISAGGLVVQYVINGYGTLFVAGTASPRKYFGLMELVGGGIDGAVATFVAQNYGAGRHDRIKEGMRGTRRLMLASSIIIAVLIAVTGRMLIGLLISGTEEQTAEVIDIGYRNILAMAACLPPLYLLYIHRSALQGMGNSLIPLISGFVELGLRIVSVLALPAIIGEWGIFFSDGIGWIGASVLLITAYSVRTNAETKYCTKNR